MFFFCVVVFPNMDHISCFAVCSTNVQDRSSPKVFCSCCREVIRINSLATSCNYRLDINKMQRTYKEGYGFCLCDDVFEYGLYGFVSGFLA